MVTRPQTLRVLAALTALAASVPALAQTTDPTPTTLPADRGREAGKTTLAVLPLRLADGVTAGDAGIAPAEVRRRFAQALVTQFAASRRFTLVDREYVDAALAEQKRVAANALAPSELATLGHLLAADYLLVGTLADAGVDLQRGEVQLTGYRYTDLDARLRADFRLIDAATGKVYAAGSVPLGAKDRAAGWLRSGDAGLGDLLDALVSRAADGVATQVLEAIHPIQVIGPAAGGEVSLNQGGERVHPGDRLDIFARGGALIDPDTGETLGPDEVPVGLVEVVRVTPRTSYARVLQGDPAAIAAGSLCRRAAPQEPPARPAP